MGRSTLIFHESMHQLCQEQTLTSNSQASFSARRVHRYFQSERHLAREAVEQDAAIRELRNVVERLIILSGDTIGKKDVFDYVIPASQRDHRFHEIFEQFDNLEALNAYIAKEFVQYKSVE